MVYQLTLCLQRGLALGEYSPIIQLWQSCT